MTALQVVKGQPAVPAASSGAARAKTVDLLVEGVNLTARIPDVDPLPLLRDLARATADLASLCERRRTVRCEWPEGLWEIGIERVGSRALFTLFRGGAFPEVCVFERDVELAALGRALSQELFVQAEDGIRYHCVTGVQTCALPILRISATPSPRPTREKSCAVSRS